MWIDLEGIAMQVLWWLVPPIVATGLAMIWVSFVGRNRAERPQTRDESDEALAKMQAALERPTPRKSVAAVTPARTEPSHGVAVRRTTARTGTDG